MAFYEQEFIEIKREKAKMEIIGTMKCSVEQEDVRRYTHYAFEYYPFLSPRETV